MKERIKRLLSRNSSGDPEFGSLAYDHANEYADDPFGSFAYDVREAAKAALTHQDQMNNSEARIILRVLDLIE